MTDEQLQALTDTELDNLRVKVLTEIEYRKDLADIPIQMEELNLKLEKAKRGRGPKGTPPKSK